MTAFKRVLISLGLFLVLLGVAYGYFVYAPVPETPLLSASARSNTIQSGGRSRTYWSYVPTRLPSHLALLLVLHGTNIDGATIRQWTGYAFDELADQHGFVVLYPDGYRKSWNDCRNDAPTATKAENVDDVGFLRALVERYRLTNGVDPAKVFVFGYSNGGQMAFRLAGGPNRFVTGVAVVAANLPVPQAFSCDWQSPATPIMLVSNTADGIVLYGGGEVRLFGTSHGRVLSARATAEQMARRNGITTPPRAIPVHDGPDDRPMPVSGLRWREPGKATVEWYTVWGGGHSVPQPRFRFPRIMGPTATRFNAPRQAVAFFGLLSTEN